MKLLAQNEWPEEPGCVAEAGGADHDESKGSTAEEADDVSLGLEAGYECWVASRPCRHDDVRKAKEVLAVVTRAAKTPVSLASAYRKATDRRRAQQVVTAGAAALAVAVAGLAAPVLDVEAGRSHHCRVCRPGEKRWKEVVPPTGAALLGPAAPSTLKLTTTRALGEGGTALRIGWASYAGGGTVVRMLVCLVWLRSADPRPFRNGEVVTGFANDAATR